MEAGLRVVYIIGAIAMLLTFLVICSIQEISIDVPVEDKKLLIEPGRFYCYRPLTQAFFQGQILGFNLY